MDLDDFYYSNYFTKEELLIFLAQHNSKNPPPISSELETVINGVLEKVNSIHF